MPNLTLYFSDDNFEWIEENIEKGKVSQYFISLMEKDMVLRKTNEEIRRLEVVKDVGLGIVGLAFVVFVLLSSFMPEYSLFFFSFTVLLGGILLLVTGLLKSFRSVKNGTINTRVAH